MASDSIQYQARRCTVALMMAVGTLTAACGGGGGSSTSDTPVVPTPQLPSVPPPTASTERGALIGALGQATAMSTSQIDALASEHGYSALTGKARCAVSFRPIEYNTIGGKGEATNATATLFIPSGTDPACQGPRPLLMYARGSGTLKLNNEPGPSRKARQISFFAAQGYIVVAPDYTGYAGSRLPYHPFQVAEAQAADAIDSVRAARLALKQLNGSVSDKLFLTGISQGGFVTMATQRTMERDFPSEFKVTASAPVAGVYAVTRTMKDVLNGRAMSYGTSLFQLIVTGYQKSYGGLYEQASDVYMPPYATGIETLSPGLFDVQGIYSKGLLPANIFDKGDGAPFLIKNATRASLQANPNNALFTAAAKNDVIEWKPLAPMIMCGTSSDQMSFFDNSTEAAAAFARFGVTVPVLDLEVRSSLNAGAIGDAAYQHYRASRAAHPTEEPHSMGHAPCLSQVASFFQSQ